MKYKILLMKVYKGTCKIVTDIRRAEYAFIESCGEPLEDFLLRIQKTLELVDCTSTLLVLPLEEYTFYGQVIYCVRIFGNLRRDRVVPLCNAIIRSFNLEQLVEPSGKGYIFRKDIDDEIFII